MSTPAAIRKHLNAAHKIAIELVEGHARRILRSHANLDEFVMAMGSAHFIKKGQHRFGVDDTLDLTEKRYFKPLLDLINEFDDSLGITGTPMRFTADGPKITNW